MGSQSGTTPAVPLAANDISTDHRPDRRPATPGVAVRVPVLSGRTNSSTSGTNEARMCLHASAPDNVAVPPVFGITPNVVSFCR
jgi:hypothetical protein